MAEKTKTIGIMGGGQLGLMIVEQAHLLGARTLCLDPAPDAPAFALSDGHIVAAYDDAAALEELCRRSDVVTYEFENVPGSVLIPLEKKYNIPQGFRPLYDSQDRLREKDNARANGLRTPLYAAVDDEASLRAALAEIGFPAVLKTRTLGYDGHGQLVLKGEADVPRALPMLSVPCILEAFVPFDFEASIVMVSDGERVIHFPIGRNVHRDGILDLCFVPAEGIDDGLRSRMAAAGEREPLSPLALGFPFLLFVIACVLNLIFTSDTSDSVRVLLFFIAAFLFTYVFMVDLSNTDRLERLIEEMSEYIAASGNDYVCHAAALRRWLNREKKEKPKKGIPDYSYKEGESL